MAYSQKWGRRLCRLRNPKILGTSEDETELVEAIKERHLPVISEASAGGRDRDRTCDPYHVKVVLYR